MREYISRTFLYTLLKVAKRFNNYAWLPGGIIFAVLCSWLCIRTDAYYRADTRMMIKLLGSTDRH